MAYDHRELAAVFAGGALGTLARAVLDELGVSTLHTVIGGSMGGARALEWAVSYPDFVHGFAVFACGAASTAEQIASAGTDVRLASESLSRSVSAGSTSSLPSFSRAGGSKNSGGRAASGRCAWKIDVKISEKPSPRRSSIPLAPWSSCQLGRENIVCSPGPMPIGWSA
ncbi:MAG: alpha/beta fold hydrolase [Proteobacteria bacterium]|nr:alpha/beta fold hydrolase [Pseudomonadota bacterium]